MLQTQTASQAAAPFDPATLAPLAERLGARLAIDDCGPQAAFPAASADELAAGFVAPLLDLGLLAVTGAQAAQFLHGQLTNDVEHLGEDEMRWYGYCTPKGRLLATLAGWKHADGVVLVAPRPQAEPLRKRLSMYVLRAKAKVLDRSAEILLLGVGGVAAPAALGALGLAAPAPMAVARADGLVAVGLPAIAAGAGSDADGIRRWLLAVPADRLDAVWAALRSTLRPAPTTAWRWTEVRAGVPRIVAGAVEQFVPQMVNLEVVGGVNFRKGCYPGQEIVARSQYLGKTKRRMFLGRIDAGLPAPGSDVVPAAGGEPAGQVVLAAPAPDGGTELLFECRIAALDDGPVTCGSEPVHLGRLPYALPE